MTKHPADHATRLRNFSHLFFLICPVLLIIRCSGESESHENDLSRLVPAVEAVQARLGALPLTERLSGVVKAKNQVEIYPEISAVILKVHVENGGVVKRGQPLVQLRDKEFRERLNQAKAAYQIAAAQARQAEARLHEIQTELKRSEALAEKGLISGAERDAVRTQAISAEADVELAKARVEQAQATVDEREETLSQTVIRAPVAGTVGNRNAEVGLLVSANARLFTLGQLDSLRVEVVLTDIMLSYIEVGQRAEIHGENAAPGTAGARLSRISPFLHPVTHSTSAEIDLANPNGRLKPGMFVAVDIHYGETAEATLVPLSALYENPATGGTGVYVSKEPLAREPGSPTNSHSLTLVGPVAFDFIPVDVIAKGRMDAGIGGVQPGQWVVSLGQDLLRGESGYARVRAVEWERVQELQHMQRQDLLQELMKRQQEMAKDSLFFEQQKPTAE